jgi:hypothetical protein
LKREIDQPAAPGKITTEADIDVRDRRLRRIRHASNCAKAVGLQHFLRWYGFCFLMQAKCADERRRRNASGRSHMTAQVPMKGDCANEG